MRRTSVALAGLWLAACQPQVPAQNGDTGSGEAAREIAALVPDTDIFLLELDEQGKVLDGSLRNLTLRSGYDNQPAFLPGGQRLLYSAIVQGNQSDVFALDVSGGEPRQLTQTAESEYSPTPLDDGEGFSVVRVEADGSQYLWRYDADGVPGQIVLPGLDTVGYHRWLDDGRLALFLVGEPMSLVLATPGEKGTVPVATGAGRAFLPYRNGLLLVMPRADGGWKLCHWQGVADTVDCPLDAPGQSQDFAVDALGGVWMAWEQSLYRWQPDREAAWETMADLGGQGLAGKISRLAFSDDGRRLALVVNMQVENTQ